MGRWLQSLLAGLADQLRQVANDLHPQGHVSTQASDHPATTARADSATAEDVPPDPPVAESAAAVETATATTGDNPPAHWLAMVSAQAPALHRRLREEGRVPVLKSASAMQAPRAHSVPVTPPRAPAPAPAPSQPQHATTPTQISAPTHATAPMVSAPVKSDHRTQPYTVATTNTAPAPETATVSDHAKPTASEPQISSPSPWPSLPDELSYHANASHAAAVPPHADGPVSTTQQNVTPSTVTDQHVAPTSPFANDDSAHTTCHRSVDDERPVTTRAIAQAQLSPTTASDALPPVIPTHPPVVPRSHQHVMDAFSTPPSAPRRSDEVHRVRQALTSVPSAPSEPSYHDAFPPLSMPRPAPAPTAPAWSDPLATWPTIRTPSPTRMPIEPTVIIAEHCAPLWTPPKPTRTHDSMVSTADTITSPWPTLHDDDHHHEQAETLAEPHGYRERRAREQRGLPWNG